MGTRNEWVHDFLAAGGYPTTDDNVRACLAWCRSEFGGSSPNPAAFNLFATTLAVDGATDYNSVGVKNYPDWFSGVRACVFTLAENQAGYQSIRDHLHAGQDASATCGAIAASVWGSHPSDAILAEVVNDPANNADAFVGDRPGTTPVPDTQPTTTKGEPEMILYTVHEDDGTTTYLRDAGGTLVALSEGQAALYFEGLSEGWVHTVPLNALQVVEHNTASIDAWHKLGLADAPR